MGTARQLLAIAWVAGSAAASAGEDPAALADSAGCGMCHHAEQAMLGPSWQAIAERYAGDEGAAGLLAQRVREGSQGVWGEAMMMPTPKEKLGDAELARVIDWILSR
ncbi:MAG: c-type cytochrome [Pseudohaliea sp.]